MNGGELPAIQGRDTQALLRRLLCTVTDRGSVISGSRIIAAALSVLGIGLTIGWAAFSGWADARVDQARVDERQNQRIESLEKSLDILRAQMDRQTQTIIEEIRRVRVRDG